MASESSTSPSTSVPKFPLDYGKVFLYDELKFRAYRDELLAAQSNDGIGVLQALDLSKKMQDTLTEAEVKRRALFSEISVNEYFGVIAQIYNTGFVGRIIAFFLKYPLVSSIVIILLILKLIF